jgi:hypothetical protein
MWRLRYVALRYVATSYWFFFSHVRSVCLNRPYLWWKVWVGLVLSASYCLLHFGEKCLSLSFFSHACSTCLCLPSLWWEVWVKMFFFSPVRSVCLYHPSLWWKVFISLKLLVGKECPLMSSTFGEKCLSLQFFSHACLPSLWWEV